jgi:hypothetical protein
VSKNLLTASGYNRNNAVDYALAHAMSPNKNYPYYSLDCTNFVSQCLSAGGIRQHHGGKYSTNSWFFINDGNRSATWTGANELHNYFLSTGCKIKVSKSSFGSVDKGDIIQLMSGGDASHSMIVTGIVWASYGHADLMISCHTANRRHVSFYQAFPNANAEYFHISGSR